MAGALEQAHAQGIIHRDIKPANLLLDTTGRLWVTDFGLARLETGTGITMSGDVMGTLRYMSPEQAQGERHAVGPHSDIYSLGATLYELLTLQPVFSTDDRAQLIQQIAEREPRRLRSMDPRVPPDLETIVLKTLQKSPEDRYPSARALADDLQRFLDQRPIRAKRPSPLTRAVRWSRRHTETLAAVISVLLFTTLVSLSLAAWAMRERGEAQTNLVDAQRQRSRALDAESLARQQEELAKRQRDAVESDLYITNAQLAQQALDEGVPQRLFSSLAAMQPRPGRPDLRGWEWYYLVSQTHRERFTFPLQGCGEAINPIAWSPDGMSLASIDRLLLSINIWDLDTGRLKRTLQNCPHDQEFCLAWSPEGQYLAAGGDRRVILVWDVETGSQVSCLRGHAATVRSLNWSKANGQLVSASDDGKIRFWNPLKGECFSSQTVSRPVHLLESSPDGKQLLVAIGPPHGEASWNAPTVQLRQADSGNVINEWEASCATFSPDGSCLSLLIPQAGPQVVRIVNWRTNERIAEYRKPCDTHPAWSRDGLHLATANRGGTIDILDSQTAAVVSSILTESDAVSVVWSPDRSALAAGLSNGMVKVWDRADSPSDCRVHRVDRYALSLAFSPDGRRLLVGGRFGLVKILDAVTAEEEMSLKLGMGWIDAVAWSPDGKYFTAKQPEVYDAQTGEPVGPSIATAEESIGSLTWSPDGKFLTAATTRLRFGQSESRVRLFDAKSRQEIAKTSFGPSFGALWSPNGKYIASGGTLNRVWDSALRQVAAMEDSSGGCIAWSSDSRLLAHGLDDGTITIYDAATWKARNVLRGHGAEVTSLAWHPRMPRLGSGCIDGTIKIWDPSAARELLALQAHTDQVNQVAWSPDGLRFASVSHDATVRIWDRSGADRYVSSDAALRREAYQQVEAGKLDEAIETLGRLRNLHSQEHLLTRQVERLKWRQAIQMACDGQINNAVSRLERLKEQSPDLPDYRLQLPRKLFQDTPGQAIAMLEKSTEEFPERESYRDELAFLYETRARQLCESGEFEEAERICRSLIEEFSDRPDFRAEIAYQMAKKGRLEETMAVFDKLADEFQEMPDYRPDLAQYLAAGGEHAMAVSIYEKLVGDYPDEPDYRARLGSHLRLRSQGRSDEALAILQSLVDEFPAVSEYRMALADAFQHRGKYFDFGQADYDKAIEAYDQAVVLVQQLIDEFPSVQSHREKLADILEYRAAAKRKKGDVEGELADLAEIRHVGTKNPDVCNRAVARLIHQIGPESRFAQAALDLAQLAVQLEPRSTVHHNCLGVAQYRAGNWEAAIQELKHLGSADEEYWVFLAMAYWQLGDRAEARRYYDRVVRYADTQSPTDPLLARYINEAAQLLGIESSPVNEKQDGPT